MSFSCSKVFWFSLYIVHNPFIQGKQVKKEQNKLINVNKKCIINFLSVHIVQWSRNIPSVSSKQIKLIFHFAHFFNF